MSRLYCKFLLDCSFVKTINIRCITTAVSQLRSQQDVPTSEQKSSGGERQSVSRAMQSYLERAQEHHSALASTYRLRDDAFMKEQEEEFIIGRRHLANMMGKDPETFTQDDINEAIRYLFPSGLFEKLARPMMKHPTELYPKQKAAEFDISGRPHHPLFYTAKPNFFFLVHQVVTKINKLNAMYIPEGYESPLEATNFLKGTKWLPKETLEDTLLEKLSDQQFTDWTTSMERLVNHPLFDKELEFLKSYRIPLADLVLDSANFPIELLPDGRKSVTIIDSALASTYRLRDGCYKKKSKGNVKVTIPGTGEIMINGQDLEYFQMIQSREMIISPLQKARLLGQVDIEVTMEKQPHMEGETTHAYIIRYGIAHGIVALGAAESEPLRLAGYLTHDKRRKERKKPGRESARKLWTYKRR